MNEEKGIALNIYNSIRLTDHLAPLCKIMDIPLLVTDHEFGESIQQFYPDIKVLVPDWSDLSPDYLIKNYDVIFQSEPWNRNRFYNTFKPLEEKYHKQIRCVHCPHGFSDKLFWMAQCVEEDILLVYGKNMLDMFEELKIKDNLNTWVRTGNYRYQYYLQNKEFYDSYVEKNIWNHFSNNHPTILYAPTCNDFENNTSFLDSEAIMDKLPSHYNLIVKIHPVLEETDAPIVYSMIGKYENKKNIVFIKDLPLVYPLLARSDIYIGDISSVGYDFLFYNRPMFFLNQKERDAKTDRNSFLFRCGIEILPSQYDQIYSIIDANIESDKQNFFEIRKKVYHYTFGDLIPFEILKENILKAYHSPKTPSKINTQPFW